MRGTKGRDYSTDTVVLLGHIDTVGIEDYGALKELALNPEELQNALKNVELSAEVRKDLESGDWFFGRGIFDMKPGIAAHMALIEEAAKKPEELRGNLLFLGVPDEEANSAGMLAALKAVSILKEKYGLEYISVIDTDYMTQRYEGDEEKYIYIGTVGKLLPCFY